VSIDSDCTGERRVRGEAVTRLPGHVETNVSAAAPGRQLWTSGDPPEARCAVLTWPERLWVYNVFWLLSVYGAAAGIAAALVGPRGWRDATFSPWATVTTVLIVVGLLHLWSWTLEMKLIGRRTKAVLSRPLRQGRHSWATASGDRVRVYRIESEHTVIPHLWPLALGLRGRVDGGREFSAEDEAEAAFEYVVELERASRPCPAATALAQVINELSARSA
jgi:hypothetical protein